MPQFVASGIVSAFGITSAAGVALVNIGVGAAFSIGAAAYERRRNKGNRRQKVSIETETTFGENVGQTILVGQTATRGHEVCPKYSHRSNGEGGSGSIRTRIFNVCDLPMPAASLSVVYVDGKRLVIDRSEEDAEYGYSVSDTKYRGKIYFKFLDGRQTTADSYLTNRYGSHATRPWTANHIGRDTCLVIVTQKLDLELFRGDSRFLFEFDGIPLYDVSQDSSAGGVGSQRYDDPTTWRPNNNPVVIAYMCARGIPVKNGKTFGGAYSADRLPPAVWIAAIQSANAARTLVNETYKRYEDASQDTLDNVADPTAVAQALQELTGLDADISSAVLNRTITNQQTNNPTNAEQIINAIANDLTEKVTQAKRFSRVGFEINLGPLNDGGTPPMEVMEEMGRACNARFCDVGGDLYVQIGLSQAITKSFSDADLLETENEVRRPFRGLEETVNAITCTYPSVDQSYEPKQATEKRDLAAEAEDGDYLPQDLILRSIYTEAQAQDIMGVILKDARRMVTHELPMPPDFHGMIPIIDSGAYSSDFNGYGAKVFEVTGIGFSTKTLNTTLQLREIEPDDDALQLGEEAINPVSPNSAIYVIPEKVPGLNIQGVEVQDNTAKPRRAGILFSWGVQEDDVRSIAFQTRFKDTQAPYRDGIAQNVDAREHLEDAVLPNTTFEGRMKLNAERETLWSNWIEFTTPQVGFTLDDMDASIAIGVEAGSNALADISVLTRDRLALLLEVSESQVLSAEYREEARTAYFTEVQERTEADLAQVSTSEALGAALGEAQATIVNLQSTKVDADEAIAVVGEELRAQRGDFEAIGKFDAIARATDNSSQALLFLQVAAGQSVAALQFAALDDATFGPGSKVELTSDVFVVNGLSIFGGSLESVDFSEGVSGWKIWQDGRAQFAEIRDLSRFSQKNLSTSVTLVPTGTIDPATGIFVQTDILDVPVDVISPTKETVVDVTCKLTVSSAGALPSVAGRLFIELDTGSGFENHYNRTFLINPGGLDDDLDLTFRVGFDSSEVVGASIVACRLSGFMTTTGEVDVSDVYVQVSQ